MVINQSLLVYPDNGLFDDIVERLRYLHQRMRLVHPNNKIYEVHEIVTTPGGDRVLYTAQFLLSSGEIRIPHPPRENPEKLDVEICEPEICEIPEGEKVDGKNDRSHFGIYSTEDPILLLSDSEIFDHQLDTMSSCDLSAMQDPKRAGLYKAMEFVQQPQTDIHGVRFVCVKGNGPSKSLYIDVTETGEKVGYRFERNSQHNYHMSLFPDRKLTTALGNEGESKLIPEVVEKEDVKFIGDGSEDLIRWARRVLGIS